jgi:ribose 5-phosphate isomerase B
MEGNDMRVAVAGDHAGYALKQLVVDDLRAAGHEIADLGTYDPNQPDDYPDFAELACEAVRGGKAARAVVICGSGVGVAVAANKFPGIRAGLCHDTYSGHQGVEHDDMNVLCGGARIVGPELAREIVRAFVGAIFTGEERHVRRLNKVKAIEAKFLRGE